MTDSICAVVFFEDSRINVIFVITKTVFVQKKMAKRRNPNRSLIEIENETMKHEIKILTYKNNTLIFEIAEWRNIYDNLKKSLDEANVSFMSPKRQHIYENEQAVLSVKSEDKTIAIDELHVLEKLRQKDEQLTETVRQLNKTRKQLSDAQEQLSVSREVAKATQIRELKQEGIYENLITDQIYENLRPDCSTKPQPTETSWYCHYSICTILLL